MVRCRSEDEYWGYIETLARNLWAERERDMPAFVRQTWEQGTPLARMATRDFVRTRLASGA